MREGVGIAVVIGIMKQPLLLVEMAVKIDDQILTMGFLVKMAESCHQPVDHLLEGMYEIISVYGKTLVIIDHQITVTMGMIIMVIGEEVMFSNMAILNIAKIIIDRMREVIRKNVMQTGSEGKMEFVVVQIWSLCPIRAQ